MYIYMFYYVVPKHINTKRQIVTNAYLSNKVHFDKISHHANEVLVFVLPERITFGHEDWTSNLLDLTQLIIFTYKFNDLYFSPIRVRIPRPIINYSKELMIRMYLLYSCKLQSSKKASEPRNVNVIVYNWCKSDKCARWYFWLVLAKNFPHEPELFRLGNCPLVWHRGTTAWKKNDNKSCLSWLTQSQ